MQIYDIFSEEALAEAISGGYVSTQVHPYYPDLTILNYTPAAQYEQVWTDVTKQCRGLIVNSLTDEVVARPFAKFFNYGEIDEVEFPEGEPYVSEKMDGSLGIIYDYDGYTGVATRGSFASDQAQWATEWLHENFPDFSQPEGVTTLVEIIYPKNRIVVDYGNMAELWLLGAIDIETGADIHPGDIDWWHGERAPQFGQHPLQNAHDMGVHNDYADDEGVVLTWMYPDRPSFRVKVKHPRYVELHRVVTNLSTRSIHEALANNTFDDLLGVVPDEFHPWVRDVESKLRAEFTDIYSKARWDLTEARFRAREWYPHAGYDRATLARFVKGTTYPGLCFAIEDGKDVSDRIWAMIRPEREMAVIIDDDV